MCSLRKILSIDIMKKSKLLRHLESNHPGCVNKPVENFQRKLKALSQHAKIFIKGYESIYYGKLICFLCFLQCFLRNSKTEESTHNRRKINTPGIGEIGNVIIGEKKLQRLNALSLSSNTV